MEFPQNSKPEWNIEDNHDANKLIPEHTFFTWGIQMWRVIYARDRNVCGIT